jgi:hypothetical protein
MGRSKGVAESSGSLLRRTPMFQWSGVRKLGVFVALLFAFASLSGSALAERGHGKVTLPPQASQLAPTSGHVGTEIEGIVTAVDSGAGTLSITDSNLGPVVVSVDDSTVIRHGWTPVALADIVVGARVHAKAALQDGGGYLAVAIFVQHNGTGGGSGGQGGSGTQCDTEVQGTVSAIDCGAGTMTVHTDSGDVDVTFDTNTVFFTKGHTASTCDQIIVGDSVEVCGTQGDTSVLAANVNFEAPEAPETCGDEASGTISSIDCGAGTMVVTTDSGDVNVTLTDTTAYFGPHHVAAACGDIVAGDAVEVEGTLQDDASITACKVSFEPPELEETEVSGTIDSIDTGAQTFVLVTDQGNVTIDTNSSTLIREHGSLKTFADLALQMNVEVDGVLQNDGSILATRISIGD